MNILGDFIKRVDSLYPIDIDNEELKSLLTTIRNQNEEIAELQKEVAKWKTKAEKEIKSTKVTTQKKNSEKPATKSKKGSIKKEEIKA